MNRYLLLALACTVLPACGPDERPAEPAFPAFNVDASRITVSGVSSGAYMAGQLHVAHSATFGGAALLAGGAYYCAEASLTKGLGPCMKGGDAALDKLVRYAGDMAAGGQIDALDYLKSDPVWLFHGALDHVVNAGVVAAAGEFYERVAGTQPVIVSDVEVTHGMPTIDKGVACSELATPFLNACGYDAAGAMLTALYSSMAERTEASGTLMRVDQPGFADAEMLAKAYLYVPTSCAAGEPCGIHVAFHGCQQSSDFVGDAFAREAGYNEWAEANNLLVLYPQVASSKMAPLNPNGCWDWWGYTGENYATKSGAQIVSVMAIMKALSAPE